MRWQICEEEDQALEYLSHRAQVLYMRGIRKFMDFDTGITGIKRRVSLQSFKELLEVRPPPGSNNVFSPTLNQVRASLDELKRAGLIEQLPKKKRTDPIVFFLPLAMTGQIRPNEQPQRNHKGGETKGTTKGETSEHPVFKGFVGEPATNGTTNTATGAPQRRNHIHPVSGNTSTTTGGAFKMFAEWDPGTDLETHAKLNGIPVHEITQEAIGEFISYWITRNDELTHSGWLHKLLQSIKATKMRGNPKTPHRQNKPPSLHHFDDIDYTFGVTEDGKF